MKKPAFVLLPFKPGGAKAWIEVCQLDERRAALAMSQYHRAVPTKYGSDEKFRFWLYREYGGAEVVMQNKKAYIRFINEEYATMFSLRWM